jgi:TonB family protein
MQSRDVSVPLTLWICAAICAHFMLGTGGAVVATVHDDKSEMWKLSRQAVTLTRQAGGQTMEISLGDSNDEPAAEPPPPPPPKPKTPDPKAKEKEPERETLADKVLKREPPKEEKKVVAVEKKKDDSKPLVLPEDPLKDRRIAVRQHAKPDQADNPKATFIADQANHVEKETVATQTSHDRDDEVPEPGRSHRGADSEPGDSDRTRIAESDTHPGTKNRAPGEKGTDFDVVHEPKIPRQDPNATSASTPTPQSPVRSAANESSPSEQPPQTPGDRPRAVEQGGATPTSPDVDLAADGTWTFNPARTGAAQGPRADATPGSAGARPPGGRMWSLPGLGEKAAPGTMNTNLQEAQVVAVVGVDHLRKLREADGERRKSEHRGSWAGSNFDRWKSAIENYVSSVKPGNQTALNTAAVPFASYLNGMHNRIHPIFAEGFLETLGNLPPSHPMNDKHLVTRLEIVLTRDGHLKKMGVVRTSGITAFDIAALDAVDRAAPFGPAPGAIVSPDGNVYLHWEFHRDEVYACSTMGARPFVLSAPAEKNEEQGPPAPGPAPAGPSREPGPPPSSHDAREGNNLEPTRPAAAVLPPHA